MTEVKDRLREALLINGMTASELAKKSGLNKGAISKYLKGTVIPKQSAIGVMADALGVSPAWLLGYDVPIKEDEIDLNKLNETNRALLTGYFKALLDSQEE